MFRIFSALRRTMRYLPVMRVFVSQSVKKKETVELEDEPTIPDSIDEAIVSHDWRVRMYAVEQLGAAQSDDNLRQLIRLFSDEDPDVRQAARANVAAYGANAISTLESVLADEEDATARQTALNALILIGAAAVPTIQRIAVEDQDANLRQLAVRSLGQPNNNNAVPTLIRALQDDDRKVYAAARNALKRINTIESHAAIKEHS